MVRKGSTSNELISSTKYPENGLEKRRSAISLTIETRTNEVTAQIRIKCALANAIDMERLIADGVSELSITTAGGTKNNRKESRNDKIG